jgi:hypothetical protein
LILDDILHIRPRQGIPAGTEALLVVESRTVRRTFLVRVAQHARDADVEVLVLPLEAQPRIALLTPLAPLVVPAPAPTPGAEPVTAPGVEPATKRDEAAAAADAERATAAISAPRFALSVHVVAALAGVTAHHIPGYTQEKGWRSHHAIGLRGAITSPDTWWSVEAGISGERLVAPTLHVRSFEREADEEEERAVSGLRLGACSR